MIQLTFLYVHEKTLLKDNVTYSVYATGFPNFFTCRQKRRIQTEHTDNGKYVMTQLMKDTHPRLLNKRKRQQALTLLNSIGQLIRQKLPLYLRIENLVYSKSATIDLKKEN